MRGLDPPYAEGAWLELRKATTMVTAAYIAAGASPRPTMRIPSRARRGRLRHIGPFPQTNTGRHRVPAPKGGSRPSPAGCRPRAWFHMRDGKPVPYGLSSRRKVPPTAPWAWYMRPTVGADCGTSALFPRQTQNVTGRLRRKEGQGPPLRVAVPGHGSICGTGNPSPADYPPGT